MVAVMRGAARAPRSTARLFSLYAAISLVPVIVLGIVLAVNLRHDATQRGLAEGRSEAVLIAHTAVQPLLDGHSLSTGLTAQEGARLSRLGVMALARKEALRLRIRNLAGRVVFSADGSGLADKPDDEALDAARGRVVARLTRLNADANDAGHTGVASVEVYLPLDGATRGQRLGVLELYLPYAPISRDITAGLHRLYLDLAVGLAVLYLTLFAITASVSRGLRREAALNAFLAHHDTLTELPNRTLFHHRAEQALKEGARLGRKVAIAIIDLDHFKDVNDTLGHHNGDRLLTTLAQRLAANMRRYDTIARLGGDEFGVILRDAGEAEHVLWRLREVIDHEVDVSGLPLSVQASIGFVIAPDDADDADSLLQRADVAMYVAKAQHAGVLRYEASLDHYDASKLSLVSELRHAIDNGQLVLHYQPQATLAEGRTDAVEALVRWQHPEHGLLYPARFMPLAERTDVIDKLTAWVLRTALTEMDALGPPGADLSVAVNVSARNIGRPAFAREVIEILEELGVPAERLIVEVTETALLTDPEHAAAQLAELAAAGVRISIDDFGRGHTSLGYLSDLPIHELKIDRSFVADMPDNQAHAAVVRSIIDLGHNLALRVVGEGVETEDILTRLRDCDCDIAQGFLLARPMPTEALARWLAPVDDQQAAA
jgi:diguanylate cyclase (GGDEF)-like protein